MTLELPVGSFADLRNQAGDTRLQRIAQNAPALQLLQTYLRSFVKVGGNADPSLLSTATAHIRDLVALVVGQRSDELAVRRGLPAARLLRIKEEICAGLESKISLDDIAARHSISPRYIRSLFEREGTTFTEFVRDERLNRARRILLNDFSQDRLISEVAYSVGFNDLSYFNREFRRKFGCSPRESKASPQASS